MRTIRNTNFLLLVSLVLLGGSARASAPEALPEKVDVQQLAAILGYVVSDYATAVGPMGVLSPQELQEQQGFLSEAVDSARRLSEGEARTIVPELTAALSAARHAQPPAEVIPHVTNALAQLEAHHDLGRIPHSAPDFERGKKLFVQGCEACHAKDGSGHTGLELSTKPLDVRDPRQSATLSPARIHGAVTYGVPGTAMPAYQPVWSDGERWDVAFYFLALAHSKPTAEEAARLVGLLRDVTPASLASQTDEALQAGLVAQGRSAQEAELQVAYLRTQAAYRPLSGQMLEQTRARSREAADAYARGDRVAARHAAIAAYLDHFEPYEPALRARDPELVASLERRFGDLRAAIDRGGPSSEVKASAERLSSSLERAEGEVGRGGASISFAAALAIALREGLEATLLLAALLALAVKSGRSKARLAVHLGWSSAVVAGICTWFLSGAVLRVGGAQRELTEGLFQIGTALLLLGASHWLLAQASAKALLSFLGKRAASIGGRGLGLWGLAFVAIYREMFEVVVFYRGLLLQDPGEGRAVALGILVGLLGLIGVVVVFQRIGKRLKPRPLLLACGALLCAISVVMVGEGVRSLQEAGWISFTPVSFPELPQLGIFATAQGLAAQALMLAALGLSLGYTLLRRKTGSTPNAPASAAASTATTR
jgi:high-affinity iron transporter